MELFSLAQVFIWYSRLHANELCPLRRHKGAAALARRSRVYIGRWMDGGREARQPQDLLAALNKRPHSLRRGSENSLLNGIELSLLSADFTMMCSAHVTRSLSMKIS